MFLFPPEGQYSESKAVTVVCICVWLCACTGLDLFRVIHIIINGLKNDWRAYIYGNTHTRSYKYTCRRTHFITPLARLRGIILDFTRNLIVLF